MTGFHVWRHRALLAARLLTIWSYPTGATIVALTAALAHSTGAVRLLLVSATLATTLHPAWRHGLTHDINATDRLTYRTRHHWHAYCQAARLNNDDQYPKVTTTVGPPANTARQILAHLLRGHWRTARRRQWIQHDITLLTTQFKEEWRTVLEETARAWYDYPAAKVTPLGNKWRLRITADELPYKIGVAEPALQEVAA